MNRRRVDNFKRNRRGLWSLFIFGLLFAVSLAAEFVSNERPIVISYKGDILFPVFNDYPEDRFGGFLAHTDYRNPETAKEIEDHGWMVWAPNRYSNGTRNLSPPTTLPSPPTWMLSNAQCVKAIQDQGGTPPATHTVQGHRDELARHRRPWTRRPGPGSSTGSACRLSSPYCWPASPPSSASRRAPSRAISAGGPISSCSA